MFLFRLIFNPSAHFCTIRGGLVGSEKSVCACFVARQVRIGNKNAEPEAGRYAGRAGFNTDNHAFGAATRPW